MMPAFALADATVLYSHSPIYRTEQSRPEPLIVNARQLCCNVKTTWVSKWVASCLYG